MNIQHAHLDLILTTEPYKRIIYSTKQLLNKKDMKIYADESGCYPPQQAASKTCMILIFILSYGKFAKPTYSHNYGISRRRLRVGLRNNQPGVSEILKNDFFSYNRYFKTLLFYISLAK